MVQFLKEGESIETMEGVCEVGLLLVDNGVSDSNVFELTVCLVDPV